jgi:gamma-glutamylcyclotransferase (GGCT)/AIG2-like uncharacterized protein YtfP
VSKQHTVAVYGSLKKGFGNHRLLTNAEYLGVDKIDGWDMYGLGGFPGIVAGEGSIHIEVYKVDDEEMARLDMLEGYPSFYDRKQVSTQHGDAWVYFLATPENYIDTCAVVPTGRW